MPLRIIHVFSSNFFAGSVAYALQLAEKQSLNGNQVYIVTDKSFYVPGCTCLMLPVSNRSFLQRFRNVRFLRNLLKKEDIHVVHAHSRAASWISFHAVKGFKTTLISTIHGKQVKHYPAKKMDIYGDHIISICPNLTTHLVREIELNPSKISTIPNGIDMSRFNHEITDTSPKRYRVISVIGRFNGPKGQNIAILVSKVFPELLQIYPDLQIRLSGQEWECFPDEGKKAFEELESKYRERIVKMDFQSDIYKLYKESDLVIGAGRVALEALLLKVPVFAMGEGCCHGILTSSTISEAIQSNFGDMVMNQGQFVPDHMDVLSKLRTFLDSGATSEDLKSWLEPYHSENVYAKVMQVYQQSFVKKNSRFIPVLMYHKVPERPIQSRHRIFVIRNKFEMHLRFFRMMGLTPITFKDYHSFMTGEKPIREFPKKPVIITFDDGYEDNYYNMLPLMKKYGFKGVLFLLGDFSVTSNQWDKGEEEYHNRIMLPEQKKAFVEAGWEIGAHTLSHPVLTELSPEKAQKEIAESKRFLEETLQTKVISFAYPYGKHDEKIRKMVSECGYQYGISTDTGGMTIEEDPYAVFRINMFPEESYFQLFKKTSKWYRSYYRRKRNQ